jgi:hypothetical protein
VHHLVLEAFVGPCPEGMECLHGDDIPDNNILSNLQWGTRLANVANMIALNGGIHPNAKLSDEQVRMVRQSLKSAKCLALELNVHAQYIRALRRYWYRSDV